MAYIAEENNQDESEKKGKEFMPNSNYNSTLPQQSGNTTGAGGAVSQSQNTKPLNQNYNIMRGLMSGQQSNAAINQNVNKINQEGQQQINTLNQNAANYQKENTVGNYNAAQGYKDWKTDTPEFGSWKDTPNSANGQAFAALMSKNPNTPLSNQYSATANYQSQYAPNQRHSNAGIQALDLAVQNPNQNAAAAHAAGIQNQAIGNLVQQQNDATGGVTALTQLNNQAKIQGQQQAGASAINADINNINKGRNEDLAYFQNQAAGNYGGYNPGSNTWNELNKVNQEYQNHINEREDAKIQKLKTLMGKG